MPGGVSYIGDLTIVESGGEITSASVGDKALLSTAADATSIEVSSSTGKLGIVDAGSSLSSGVQRSQMSKHAGRWIRGALAISDANAGVFQVENTYGSNLCILAVVIEIDTVTSVGGTTLDVGVGESEDASYANLIDGLALTSDGVYSNVTDPGSGGGLGLWETDDFINATASASPTSLVGFYGIYVVDLTS